MHEAISAGRVSLPSGITLRSGDHFLFPDDCDEETKALAIVDGAPVKS